MRSKKSFTIVVALFTFFHVSYVYAAQVTISPLLVDVEGVPRDVITRDITLTNNTDHKLRVFATVNEISLDSAGEIKEFISPSMTDRASTITSWTEIIRSRIEIEPGATTSVPLTLRIHPSAQPGIYTEFIGFAPEPNRPLAEADAMRRDVDGVMVKVAVIDKKAELLRISQFLISKFVFLESGRDITVEVENRGDTDAVPTGEIVFYNSRGEEVGNVPLNQDHAVVTHGKNQQFAAKIPFFNMLGRFKANVKIAYGEGKQQASLFDTEQFFMVPFKIVILLLIAIIVFSLLITYLLRRAFYDEQHEEDDDSLPLYIRNDREHETKDHDIHLTKN
jgi:hypothetical protein